MVEDYPGAPSYPRTSPLRGWPPGHLVDLYDVVDETVASAAFCDYLLELVSSDGHLWGVWYDLDAKSLMWYPADDFATAEYPETWGALRPGMSSTLPNTGTMTGC